MAQVEPEVNPDVKIAVALVIDISGSMYDEIGEAKAQGPVAIAQLGDLARRELRHQYRDFQDHGPQPAGMRERLRVEALIVPAEPHQIKRRQIACRVVQEHVLRAWVRSSDLT